LELLISLLFYGAPEAAQSGLARGGIEIPRGAGAGPGGLPSVYARPLSCDSLCVKRNRPFNPAYDPQFPHKRNFHLPFYQLLRHIFARLPQV